MVTDEFSSLKYFKLTDSLKKGFEELDFLYKTNLKGVKFKIKNALKFIRKAGTTFFSEDKLLNYVIALETLLLSPKDWSKGAGAKDAKVISKIKDILDYYPGYENTPDIFESIYHRRHGIVHNGLHNIKLERDEEHFLKTTNYYIISNLLGKKQHKSVDTAISSILKKRNDYYGSELQRFNSLNLDIEYNFIGNVYIGETGLSIGTFKAKIKIENYPLTRFIDAKILDIKNINIEIPKEMTNARLYIDGDGSDIIIDKAPINASAFNLHSIIGLPTKIFTSDVNEIRLLSIKYIKCKT
jgi:hypothetical protein